MGIDLKSLTEEQKAELKRELRAEEASKRQKVANERNMYVTLKGEFVQNAFLALKEMSGQMAYLKKDIFKSASAIIELKNELFNTKENRNSDTFTNEDGTISIKIGKRTYEGWDDNVEIGIQKVQQYLRNMARDDNSAVLVETVMGLLAKDHKGALKASKVLELEKLALKTEDEEFIDGINIIKAAYRPQPSCSFVEVKYKNEEGKEESLPLSMSTVE